MKTNARLAALVLFVLIAGAAVYAQEVPTTDSKELTLVEGDDLPRWSASGTLGYSLTRGNSRTNTFSGGVDASRLGIWTNHFLTGGITYGNVSYQGQQWITNANYYFGAYRFEGYLHESKKPYLWAKVGASSDQFAGYWQRYTVDTGPGYSFFGKDVKVLKLEAGYLFMDTEWIELKEIEDNEFHYWEPTHNGLVRLIASIPVREWVLFTEEALAFMNLKDDKQYQVHSTSGITFKVFSFLSFQSSYRIAYVNDPGFVPRLDENGAEKTDAAGNTRLILADRTDHSWINSVVITFF